MANTKKLNKKPSSKKPSHTVFRNEDWSVVCGELTKPVGRPEKVGPLFKAVGEKIPFDALSETMKELSKDGIEKHGVYIAHDSMGYPRYIGRGKIQERLRARWKAHPKELFYFSFFVVEDPVHEREVETIMIRAAGPLLDLNERKVRYDIGAGDVRDFEPGTRYFERQHRKGPKKS